MDRVVRIIALLVIIALLALSVWAPSLIPVGIRALIGWIAVSLVGIGAVLLFVMWTFAQAMRS